MHTVFFPADSRIPLSRSAWNVGSSLVSHAAIFDASLEPLRPRVCDGLPPYDDDDDLPSALTEISPLLIGAGQQHRTKRIQV